MNHCYKLETKKNSCHFIKIELQGGMEGSIPENKSVRVTLDQLLRDASLDVVSDRPYAFVYYLSIHNEGNCAITIQGRKWVLTNCKGQKIVLEGEGVVGESPKLKPGESFHYNSYHLVDSSTTAEGAYFGVDENSRSFFTRIPRFVMEV